MPSHTQVLHWLEQLTEEIFERLKVDREEASYMSLLSTPMPMLHLNPLQNSRLAELLVVHFHPEELPSALSRSCPLPPPQSSSSPASVARSLWTAMMRGHSGVGHVDPAVKTPLTWFASNMFLLSSSF